MLVDLGARVEVSRANRAAGFPRPPRATTLALGSAPRAKGGGERE
jgi:hypothetical protein